MKKIYAVLLVVLFVGAAFAQDKKVLVVSSTLPADDAIVQKILDKVNAMDGIQAMHMAVADYTNLADFTPYDMVVETEMGGSTAMVGSSNAGWPVPVVSLKTFALNRGANPILSTRNAENFYNTPNPAGTEFTPGMDKLVVTDKSSIFCGYNVGDVVTFTTGFNPTIAPLIGQVCGFDLTIGANPLLPAGNAKAVANSKLLADENQVFKSFLWTIEENTFTKRIVEWGVGHGLLELATDDFYKVLGNCVKWALKMPICGMTSVDNTLLPKFSIHPNPATDAIHFSNAGNISNISIIDMTGKTVITGQFRNEQEIRVNMSGLSKGLYMVRISDINGEIDSEKIVKQ